MDAKAVYERDASYFVPVDEHTEWGVGDYIYMKGCGGNDGLNGELFCTVTKVNSNSLHFTSIVKGHTHWPDRYNNVDKCEWLVRCQKEVNRVVLRRSKEVFI